MQFSFAQKTVTGTVTTASDGLPLPGASVTVKGAARGVQTDFDGKYAITVDEGEILVISYVGMQSFSITIKSGNIYNAALKDDSSLEEVVVTGYATTAKAKSSSASSQLSARAVDTRPNASFVQTLTGQVAGLDIATSSGQPGANSLVTIRGTNSINGNVEPLFLIDGIVVNEDNFRSLNTNEIGSITVLKDAGATAIYGSRGANGVILITTRRGSKNSGLQVGYTGITSFSSIVDNSYDLATGQEQLRLQRTAGVGRGAGLGDGAQTGNNVLFPGTGAPFTDAEIAASNNFDWLSEFFRTGRTENHTITLSSGSENASQFTSIGYFNQEGILRDSNLQRFNLRNNTNGSSSNGKFNYSTSVSVNYSKDNSLTSVGTNGVNQNPLFGAFLALPYFVPADQPTSQQLANDFFLAYSPFYIEDKLNTDTELDEEIKIIAGLNGSYRITDDFTANFQAGIDYQNVTRTASQAPISRNQLRFNPLVDGFAAQSSNRQFSFQSTTSLNWNKQFGKHSLGAGVYLEYFKAHLRSFGFVSNGLDPILFVPGDDAGFLADTPDDDARVDTVAADRLDAGLLSYFGSFNYDYDSKYGFDATIRRDASYRFATTNRYATFYSVAGRWNISNEDFMSDSVFSNLKLRASYGEAGNQRITGNSYFSGADLTQNFYTLNQGYAGQDALNFAQLGNDQLRWETVAQANIGIDYGLWNNRLRGSVDVYRKKTTDLFQSGPISGITGSFTLDQNIGVLFNRGVDLDITYDLVRNNDLLITVGLVGNYNKTEVNDLPSEDGEIIGIGRNGGILGEVFNFRYAGVNPANGNLLFLDIDGNLTENPDVDNDRVWQDRNGLPNLTGSFNFNVDYKGWFLQAQVQFEEGRYFTDVDYLRFVNPDNIGQFRSSTDLFRAWTPDNRITDIPSLTAANDNFTGDRFLIPADFVRVRFLQLGYNFSTADLEGTGFTKLRVFGNAENLLTFTSFRGFDVSSRLQGLEFPTPKIFSIGVELGL